jgi:alkylhydroperoxidase family enzyme
VTDPARIPPLDPDELDEAGHALVDSTLSGPAGSARNLYLTLVRHPGLFRRWLPFGGKLLAGRLPARDRELLILRTGWHCRAPYEWGQHVVIGRRAGLTDAEIDRIRVGPTAPGWSPADAALLRAADELHADARVSDGTWAELAGAYGTEALIEIPMVVGHHHLVSFTLNTLGVPLEEDLPPMPGPDSPAGG